MKKCHLGHATSSLHSNLHYKPMLFLCLEESPYISFALQACDQMGPAVDDLVVLALSCVRSSANSMPDVNVLACLSDWTLEQILKDKETKWTEFELFKLIPSWVESSPLEALPGGQP